MKAVDLSSEAIDLGSEVVDLSSEVFLRPANRDVVDAVSISCNASAAWLLAIALHNIGLLATDIEKSLIGWVPLCAFFYIACKH